MSGGTDDPSLAVRLAHRIVSTGPITVAAYMEAVLADPDHGYYRHADPLGAGGDFVTAPEISQMFGELIGAWLADCWIRMGRPNPVRLIELGPGRGTLLADALRATRSVPGWTDAVDLHLIDINGALRACQSVRLGAFDPRWHETVETVPPGPLLLVANEFFDALPIRQFEFDGRHWRERLIGWSERDGFQFCLSPSPSLLAMATSAKAPPAPGRSFEFSPAAAAVTTWIGRAVVDHGGAALIIDYGGTELSGSSLQALRRHAPADPLDQPGSADLSAHVDFGTLTRAAREAGAAVYGPVGQASFLAALGIAARAERLKAAAAPAARIRIDSEVARLTGAEAMGRLFKVLAIARPGLAPAGFDQPAAPRGVGESTPRGAADS